MKQSSVYFLWPCINFCLFVFVHWKSMPVFFFVSLAHLFIPQIHISPPFFYRWYPTTKLVNVIPYMLLGIYPGGTSGSPCDRYSVNNGCFQLRDADCMGPWEGFHSADNVVAQQAKRWLTSVIRIYAHLYSVMFMKFNMSPIKFAVCAHIFVLNMYCVNLKSAVFVDIWNFVLNWIRTFHFCLTD